MADNRPTPLSFISRLPQRYSLLIPFVSLTLKIKNAVAMKYSSFIRILLIFSVAIISGCSKSASFPAGTEWEDVRLDISGTTVSSEDITPVIIGYFSVIDRFGSEVYSATEVPETGYKDEFTSSKTISTLKFSEQSCSYSSELHATGKRTTISYILRNCTFNEGEYSAKSEQYPSYDNFLKVTSSKVTLRAYDPNNTSSPDHYVSHDLLELKDFKFSYKSNSTETGTKDVDGIVSTENKTFSYNMSGNVIDFTSSDGLYWSGTLNQYKDEISVVQIEPEKKEIGLFSKK